ncbi:plasmid related protein [Stenotrophomonas maltophilia]|nr:plasmid related protein [Stenotrophomonas maltophilia]
MPLVARHVRGDFGDLCDEDRESNRQAIQYGSRVLSSYELKGGKVWIITEADRSVTTVLLPSDY